MILSSNIRCPKLFHPNKLKKSAPSRIVNVSSLGAKLVSNLDVENLNKHPQEGRNFSKEHCIEANSKLCNIFFTTELAKKLNGTGVVANVLHPGSVKTNILHSAENSFFKCLITFLQKYFFKSAEEGAQTTIYVALSKDIDGVSGELFDNCRQVEMYEVARDVMAARKVWTQSEVFVKLKLEEKLEL